MGSLADFDRLLAAAHARGIRVILDQVLSHTSDEHPWFVDSAAGGVKRDWYVWADAKPDGTPPNNWLAAFGGAAWSWHPRRRQYYFHKFLKQQPKLNFHQPAVVAAVSDVLRFWLDRGVDGFRLDVANSYLHDAGLRDNPPVPMAERRAALWGHPPRLQRHIHDANLPENAAAMRVVRAVIDEYDDRFVFGEFSEEPEMVGRYAGGDGLLHSGYSFEFLLDHSFKPDLFSGYYEGISGLDRLWPCITFSTHDVARPVTRWRGDEALAKLALTLLLALRGTVLLYQGEELGLPNVDLERAQLRDPFGDLYYPWSKGRDGCRTPMPWEANSHEAGFTSGTPWLPIPPAHRARAWSVQEPDPDSVLAQARRTIAARKAHPALVLGAIRFLEAPAPILAFERAEAGERILCLFNLGTEPARLKRPAELGQRLAVSLGEIAEAGEEILLPARSAYLGVL
jgi:alpha-glucosidase